MSRIGYGNDIVKDGLVLHLDAANPQSYDGNSNIWRDLSGNNNSVTLSNGVVYNNGALTFDGVDDYANFYAPNLKNVVTVEMWAKFKSFGGVMPFGWNVYDVFCWNGAMGYNTANSDVYGITSATVNSLGLLNNWKHYVFEMRSDVAYTNNKIYINGVSQTLTQVNSTESGSARTFNNGNGKISGWKASANYLMPMDVFSFRVYNKSLLQQEILQNYNATKHRYL